MTRRNLPPGTFTNSCVGNNGLRGRTAVEMRDGNPWGELTTVEQGLKWVLGEDLVGDELVPQVQRRIAELKKGTP